MFELKIKPGQLSLHELRQISRQSVQLSLDEQAIPAIHASTQVVNDVIAEDRTVYVLIRDSVYWRILVSPQMIWKNCNAVLSCPMPLALVS